jgi:hypothetical protein
MGRNPKIVSKNQILAQTTVINDGTRKLDSLHVWQIFAQSEIGQRDVVKDHRTHVKSLDPIIQEVYHPACAWVTTLDIFTKDVASVDLVRISELQNLRRFNMATDFPTPSDQGFNDRVLKTWAEQAQEKGAFARLQSIFLHGQGVGEWSLGRLTAFPALDEFCAYRSNVDRPSTISIPGWRTNSR